jgi:FkbM family methyltransferase
MDIKNQLISLPCLYEKLKIEERPILLYGMGDGAEKIHKELINRCIKIQGVFASEGFLRGQSFLGYKVMSLSEAEKKYGSFTAVLCFALEGEKAKILEPIKQRHTLYSPNIPVYGEGVCDKAFILSNIEKIQRLYGCLADGLSKEILLSVLKYNITGDTDYLNIDSETFSYPEGFFMHNKRHIDVGAYDGDTVLEYVERNGNYTDIVAFEPDKINYKKLKGNISALRDILCENAAVTDKDGTGSLAGKGNRGTFIGEGAQGNVKTVSIDSYCRQPNINVSGTPVGSIKIDAEGMDRQVLQGAVNVIYKNRPDIMAAVYHRAADIFDLPLLLRSYDYKYKLYLRKKEYVPAWDIFVLAANNG